jgi:hypothetical protein
MPLGEIKNCDPNVMPSAPGRRSAAALHPRSGDSAGLRLFEDESNMELDASFAEPAENPIEFSYFFPVNQPEF